MPNIVYVIMAVICFVLGGIATYFAANSYKEEHWWMFIYDVSTILLNLVVMFISLVVLFK